MLSYPSPFPDSPRRDRGRPAFARLRRFLPALSILGVLACAQADGPDREAKLNEQRLQIMQRFAIAQNGIRNTQAQALGHPDLQPLRERFDEVLRERILSIDPAADSLLDRARVIGRRMEELSQPILLPEGQEPPADDRAAVVAEFQALEQAIRPLQQQAMSDPAVVAAFNALQDSLHATMIGMDSSVGPTLIRMEALSAELEEVDEELRSLLD